MEVDWIQGQKFKDIADAIYAPMPKSPNAWEEGDYDNLQNTFDPARVGDVGDRPFVVYTHTMYAPSLIPIIRTIDHSFVLVTHNSDCFIDVDGVGFMDGLGNHWKTEVFSIPDNIVKWYSTNVATDHPKVEAIPTGLANEWWCPEVCKKEKMIAKFDEPRVIRNLVYMDHNIVQNPQERLYIYEVLGDKPWVTAERRGLNFPIFLDNVYNHKFVVCPAGNGLGTHREWEALYMGTIPIQRRNFNNRFYSDMPICFIDAWTDVTEDFLNGEYERLSSLQWNKEMLTFAYWKNKILTTR